MSKFKNLPKIFKKKVFWIIAAIVMVIAVICIIVAVGSRKSDDNANLPIFPVQTNNLSDTIKLSGSVKTVFLTEVNTKAEGIVTKIYVENGQQVRQGDKLFEIELSSSAKQKSQSAYNSLLSAQNSLQSAEAQLYSLKQTLFAQNQKYIDYVDDNPENKGDSDYIQVESGWLASEANYKVGEDKLAVARQAVSVASLDYQQYRSTVTAPVTGEISGIAVTQGMMITSTDTASQRLAVVKTGDTLLIQLNVNELDIGKVKVGQEADVVLTATGDTIYQGEVLSIDQIGVSTNNTPSYPVLIGFTAPEDSVILPNMTADVTIKITNLKDVLAVSSLAVNHDEQGYYVNLVTGHEGSGQNAHIVTERRSIEIGLQTEDLTEITSGLAEGDRVQMNDFNAMFGASDLQQMMMRATAGPNMGGPAAGGQRQMQIRTAP